MDVTVPYLQPPATIVNQAIDVLGMPEKVIGDIADGTRLAEVARRNYGQALRRLLRTSHWPFARKRARLQLLGDATGSAAPPISGYVESPWQYAYAWPIDGVQGRWLPANPTNAQPLDAQGVPLTTAPATAPIYAVSVPGRFLVSSSDQYPVVVGVPGSWAEMPDLQRTEGAGPTARKVILTDCGPCAEFVYTRFVPVIEEWDDLFRQAMVLMIALAIAPSAYPDQRERFAIVNELSPRLKNAIDDARLAAGNEAGYPQTTDFEASFIRGRNYGAWAAGFGAGYGLGGGGGLGYFGMGWDSLSWAGGVY